MDNRSRSPGGSADKRRGVVRSGEERRGGEGRGGGGNHGGVFFLSNIH